LVMTIPILQERPFYSIVGPVLWNTVDWVIPAMR
jgi:hypothetical protein